MHPPPASGRFRAALAWHPPDVRRYVLACQWRRGAQEEAFVGRTGELGDELGCAYEALATAQNDTGLAERVDPTTRPYFDRPFQVLKADRLADALLVAVTDPAIATLPRAGAIDQHADNTDLLTDARRSSAVAHAVLSPRHPVVE